MSRYDYDPDEEIPDEVYEARHLQRLGLDRCRCHSRSEEPCAYCSTPADYFGEPDPNEERARLEAEQHARVCELLDAPVDSTLYATPEDMQAARDAALSEEDGE